MSCGYPSLVVLSVFLLFCLFINAGSDPVVVGSGTAATPTNLTCYACMYISEREACIYNVTTMETRLCRKHEKFCEVERFIEAGELITFTRRCSSSCEEGCVTAGSAHKYESCVSCCSENLCNVDNKAGILFSLRNLFELTVVAYFVHTLSIS